MISGLNALDWVGTLLQSGCGEEAALISDTQGQVRIKSPLNTLPPYVCVWGERLGGMGERIGCKEEDRQEREIIT